MVEMVHTFPDFVPVLVPIFVLIFTLAAWADARAILSACRAPDNCVPVVSSPADSTVAGKRQIDRDAFAAALAILRQEYVVGDPDPNTDDEDDAGIIAVDEDESRLVAEFLDELRRRLGTAAHGEALATLVVNNDGREACFCPLPEDADGLYVLFFNQGTFHGSKKISTDAAQLGETVMLPVLFSPKNMSDAVLTAQMLRHMQAHNAVVVAVDCSKEVRNALCQAWQKDLESFGGKVPAGSPNSSRVGIIRSNGLPFGTFARQTRAHAELRRCWRLLALALGRDDVFPAPPRGASQPAVISSFDGILYTKDTDNFTGLKPHTDTYPPPHGETGQLQALAYVHPPPPGVLRLGCAVAFYPAKAHSLWRDYLLALVTRWPTSPDVDLRKGSLPELGSQKGRGKHRFVLGGPYLAKKDATKLSDAELQAQALKLPPTLGCLAHAACQHKTTKFKPEEYFKQWRSSAHCVKGANKERWQLLQSVGKGTASRKDFSANLLRSAKDCLNRAHRFGAPLGQGSRAAWVG